MVPLLVQPNKFQVDSERKYMGLSTMFKENIIKLTYTTLLLSQSVSVLKPSLGLDLIDPRSSYNLIKCDIFFLTPSTLLVIFSHKTSSYD